MSYFIKQRYKLSWILIFETNEKSLVDGSRIRQLQNIVNYLKKIVLHKKTKITTNSKFLLFFKPQNQKYLCYNVKF